MRARSFGPFFIVAGLLHFVVPRFYDAIVPRWVPGPRRRVTYVSGVAEIVAGAAILHPRTRRLGGRLSVATLLAVFPANVEMALRPERHPVPGGAMALYARLPLQAVFVAWARAAARG
jgi:uncharacterized membrane protein